MTSPVAHELNQPLAAIGAFLHTATEALDREDAPRARRDVFEAAGQAVRAGETVKHMRALLTRDTGHQAPADPCDMIDKLMPLVRIAAREAGVAVSVDMMRGDLVLCERVQVQQVLMNLVRNAIEAVRGQAERRIVISGKVLDPCHYEVRVDDTGSGLAPGMEGKIFEPMTSTKLDGLGVGLSICRTIIEAHGGAISHRPSPLGGTAFVFSLLLAPCVKAA
jgi:two-component system sensor kinase FixL